MDEVQTLGNIVRRQRNRLGLTLVELAEKSGVSISHLGRITYMREVSFYLTKLNLS